MGRAHSHLTSAEEDGEGLTHMHTHTYKHTRPSLCHTWQSDWRIQFSLFRVNCSAWDILTHKTPLLLTDNLNTGSVTVFWSAGVFRRYSTKVAPLKPVQNQISGLVAVAKVDNCNHDYWKCHGWIFSWFGQSLMRFQTRTRLLLEWDLVRYNNKQRKVKKNLYSSVGSFP